MPTQEETVTKLGELVQGLHEYCQLQGYAAEAAAKMLVENWRDAMRDGSDLGSLVGDVDDVIKMLVEFKADVSAIPEPSAAPSI